MTKDKELPGGSGLTYRLANQADYIEYYGARPAFSAKAYIFYKDGEPVGLGGYKLEAGNFILFTEIKENATLNKVTIIRAGQVIVSLLNHVNAPVVAASKNDRLCIAFGGEKVGEELFKW